MTLNPHVSPARCISSFLFFGRIKKKVMRKCKCSMYYMYYTAVGGLLYFILFIPHTSTK